MVNPLDVNDPFKPAKRPQPTGAMQSGSASGAKPLALDVADPFAPRQPVQKVAKRPERTWGEAIKDTGLGIATGAANIIGGAIEQRNSLEPTNLVRQGLRGLDRLGVKGASETAALVPGTPSEILGGRRAGSDSAGLSKATQMATDYLGESQSEALKQEKQELQDTKGFFASAGKVLSSPRLIGNFLAEQVPNIAAMGAGTRAAAAQAGERAMAGALAKGLGTEAAETAATAAGHRAATAAATGMTTVMETGSAGQQTYQQAMAQPQSVWDANPEYKRMVAAGGDPQTVKETIARGASMEAQAITAPIAAIAGRIAAPFEADVFTRGLARKPKAMLAGAARETVEEGLQEGGSQLAGNLGQRQVDPAQAAWEGVPEAAGTGAAIGGLLGGGMAAGGAIASRGDNQAAVAADAERERLARRPVPTPPSLPPPPIPQMLALPPPEVMTAAPDGTITPGGVRPEVMAEPEMRFPQGRGMSAPFDGRRVAARPQPSVPFPDAVPDSIADIANLVSQARRPNEPTAIAPAAAAIAEPVPAQVQGGQAGLATPEVPEAAAPPLAPAVAPPWVDAQTGEALREPTPTDIKQLLHNGLQYQVETHGGINTPTLLRSMRDQYGLPSARVRPLLEEVKGERRRGLTEPPADAGAPAAAQAASTAPLPQRNAAPQADLQLDGPATTDRSAPAALASELQLAPGQVEAHSDTGSSRGPVAEPRAVGATDATTLAETAPERPIAEPAPGQDTASAPSEAPKVATAAAEAATNPQNDLPAPTDAQKEAGNYKKGHVRINGHDISIENPAGSQRDPRWPALKNHYGYFKGTVGKDKDHVDVFMTDRAEDPALPVYVVDQVNKDGSFDEHKVIMGTASEQEARDTYLANYSKGWTGLGGIKQMSQEQFKAWVRDPKKTTRRVTRTKPAEAAPAPQPATSVGETGQIVSTAAETVGATAESGSALAKNGTEPAAAAAPAAGEPGPAYTPKVRRIGGSPQYDRGDIGTLGAYFTPGRIVNAYGNTRDRVIEFRPPGKDPRWQVKVQQVDSAGNPLPDEDPRWHSTIPSPNDLEKVLGKPVAKARKAAAPAQNSTAATDAAPALSQKQAAGPAVIEDLGEKLGGARKDLAKPTGARPQRRADPDGDQDTGAAWSKKYVAMEDTRNPGTWRLFKAKKGRLGNPLASRQTFASQAEADAAIPMVELARNHRAVERAPNNWAIARDVTDRKRVYLKDGFDTRAAALQYMAEHAPALIDTRTTVGEDALPRPDKVMRIGEARREGDVQGQQFMDTFGFRGVEFGKWNNQDERQEVMNHAFDALVDLSELLNLPPRAMSLDGQIGLAFGARGHGLSGARAHYERDYAVINLTKLKGAGSLAHEWMHALDHYLGRQDGRGSEQVTNGRGDKVMKASGVDDYLSNASRLRGNVRPELRAAFQELMDTMRTRAEQYVEDTARAESFLGKARDQVQKQLGDLRAHIEKERAWGSRKRPATQQELAAFDAAADRLLNGETFSTDAKPTKGGGVRFTNEELDTLDGVLKAVTNRTGFNSDRTGSLDRLRDAMGTYQRRVELWRSADAGEAKTKSVPTSFMTEARKLDDGRVGNYWTTPHELLARAFSSYVEDRLQDAGRASVFMSFGSDPRFAVPVGTEFARPFPGGAERQAMNAAFDRFFAEVKHEETPTGGVRLFSRHGWEADFPDVVTAHRPGRLSAHADYDAAKAGDDTAALRVARDVITPEFVQGVRAALPEGSKPLVVAVQSQEATGNNRIPRMAAEVLAQRLGLQVSEDIVQAAKVNRSAGDALHRLANQPPFTGKVEKGRDYVLIDDTLTQGGTLAQLKTHIEDNGGKVVLATALTGKDYSRKIALNSQSLADVRERFGSIEPWWRDQFGYGFEGLTESEARTILTLDKGRLDADAFRDRVAAGRVPGLRPVGEGAVGEGSGAEAPGPGGRVNRSAAPAASGGLDFDRALQLKTDLTQHWGENAPSVVVVRSAEDFPASAKVDPGYRRAEGVYDGRPTVWINAGNIATEQRFAQVLAHEAIGHYGVESVVGAKDWAQIVDAIDQLAANGSGSAALKSVLADVTRRYGTVDRETFAKEAIAVMAERGIRNSFTSRVAAAVRRFLRRVMPSLKWSETEVRDLLSQADGFLRAGMSAQAQREMVRSYSFAQPQIDGRGEAFLEQNGGRFLRRDDQWYLANERGRPADFLTLGAARAEAERTGGQVLADPVESGPRTWSVVLPNGAEVTRAARGRLFSMPPADALEDIDAIQRGIQGEGVLARARQKMEDLSLSKVKDSLRSTWLGALATRHLTELGRDYFPTIDRYSDYLAEMQADRNKLQAEADTIAEAARQWASKNKAESRRLFDLMHQATMDGVDPSREYQPLQFRMPGEKGLQVVNRKSVLHAIKVKQQQMRERSGDSKTNIMNEVKALKAMLKAEPRRRRQYAPLVEQWSQLSPEAKSFYLQFRDAYRSRSDAVEEALVQRIEDLKGGDLVGGQVISDSSRRMLVHKIREQFESARLQGVYFPLQRFGKFFVAAEKDGTNTFLMFESQNELDRAVKDLQAREWAITARGMKMEGKAADAPSGTFVADVIDQLRTAHVSDAVQDQVYQLYLQTMPELSMRKHQIHRKSVPGFDPDAVRAFAYNMQHGSHQLARLRYAHKLQGVLTDLKDAQKKIQASPSVDTRKIVAGDALLEELGKRHDWIMNPTDSALTNLISSFGFTYYLGATPAAALVNVTQTALVSYPYLAARHGGVKAMNYLLAASRDAVRTVGNIQKTLTDPDELRAYQALEVAGAIEKTQAHNLAGIAEGGMTGYNPAWSKAMEIIGWGFHKTEVINREATGMAAYRLARADGKSFDEAVKFARDAIFDTHFDYSNANRARFMQSGTAKVLLMFRQYSLNMTWALGRMVWQATKGQDPQVRQIARRNLTGLLGMSALFSGAMGLPMMGMIMGALNGLQATFGDDDEPWDAETELRAFLTGMLGQGGADLLLHGPADKLTGANISGRVGLDSLWIRDADRELDGRGMFNNLLEQAAGPMGGVLKNVLVGKQHVDEGHIMRGIETMLPKGLKDVIKAGRYATQGVNTLRGDPVVADLSPWEILLQANGFAPEKVSRQYETTRALKNYEQHILDRRKSLVNAFAMALRNGDAGDRASVLVKIRDFNRVNPELAITSSGLQQSIKNRARYSARAEAGIVLNPKLAARLNKAVTE
ncbi:TPA: PLxRFG domain-containing protein [Stenotrophomonas maltophilia]|uniref:PLxRFG domain-containing protein n=2 Tax=Stenotrophomonas maltophilia TaxID=40324 RepID=UPI001F53378D|nr:PLxRFG domain-containing protein [Stenotrophomonas maltophilia]